jgi:hypothetical protein
MSAIITVEFSQADSPRPPRDDMALNEKEKKRLANEIQTAVEQSVKAAIGQAIGEFQPHGWRRVTTFLREWGLAGTAIAVPIALLAIVITLGIFAATRITKEATFEANTTKDIGEISARLDHLDQQMAAFQLTTLSKNATEGSTAHEVAQVLQAARQSSIQISPEVLRQAGDQFIEASVKQPLAWNAAIEIINYRSFVALEPRKEKTVPVPANATTHFDMYAIPGKPSPKLSNFPTIGVKPENGAVLERIGQNLNKGLSFGTAALIASGGATTLDFMHIEHVAFENVEIHYSGKALIMRDVLFINCKFVIDNTDPGRKLGETLLAGSPVTFTSAG